MELSTSLAGLDTFNSAGNLINITDQEPDCDCPDDQSDCNNSVSIDFECVGNTINLSLVSNYGSPVDTEEFLCSTDGVTYIPCPATISGEERVFVLVDVSFTDGCDPIHVEQEIICVETLDCPQSTMVSEGVDENCLLQLSFTDNFGTANALEDTLTIGGQSFSPASSYAPIQLSGSGEVTAERVVIFDNGCPDLIITRVIEYDCTNAENDCDIAVTINPSDTILTANVTGCDTTPTYQWYLEVNGAETALSNAQSVALSATGNYIVEVTCGTCDPVRANYTYIAGKLQVEICNEELNVNITNECVPVEIKEAKTPPNPGTANPIAKP